MYSFGNIPHCVLSISHSILELEISDIIYLCHNIRRLHHRRWLAAVGSSTSECIPSETGLTASCRSVIRCSNERSVILFIYVIISGGFTIRDGSLPMARALRKCIPSETLLTASCRSLIRYSKERSMILPIF